jgi:hypothetical protein
LEPKNEGEQLAALAFAKVRDVCEAVLSPSPTAGAAALGQLFLPAPCKPDGLRQISRKNLISKFTRVKYSSVYEFTV